MDQEEAIKIAKSGRSTKAMLRTALCFMLEIECPTFEREKASETLVSQVQTIASDRYHQLTGFELTWSLLDNKALKEIITKMEKHVEKYIAETQKRDYTEDDVVQAMRVFFTKLPKWYCENFSIPTINKQFSAILANIKQTNGTKNKTGVTADYAARQAEILRGE